MKNIAKQVLGCIVCWAAVLAVCFGLLCAAAAVPDDSIKDNLVKSAEKLATDDPHGKTVGNIYHSVQDNYADAILLGIAANMDSDDVFTSALYRRAGLPLRQQRYRHHPFEFRHEHA